MTTLGSVTIRPVKQEDVPALETIIGSTELFPPELLGPMLGEYFAPKEDDPTSPRPFWIALIDTARSPVPIGVAYATYETLTEKTWNLLLIAVLKTAHGEGYGTQLLGEVEHKLHDEQAARILLVETSGDDEFAATRRFYDKRGYAKVATIPDFYADGDDKIVFSKRLAPLAEKR